MISRYQNQFVVSVFSTRIVYWTNVSLEILRVELGLDRNDFIFNRMVGNVWVCPDKVLAAEKTTHHDVMAFLQIFEEQIREHGNPDWVRFIHRKATSSDLVDTAMALMVETIARKMDDAVHNLIQAYQSFGVEKEQRIVASRTHGQVALPAPAINRWFRAGSELVQWGNSPTLPGKLGGPTGLFYTAIERDNFSKALRVKMVESHLNQCVSRHLYVEYMGKLKVLSGILESHATMLRLHMIEGVAEYETPRPAGHVGSSSMPHKNNPVELEKVCGLSRLVRGYELAISESANLWHERDMSHSCVERIAIEDALHCIFHQLETLTQFVGKLKPVSAGEMAKKAEIALAARHNALREIDAGSSRAESWEASKKPTV